MPQLIRHQEHVFKISVHSNHPPLVLSNIPDAISKRLSSVSSSQEMFESEVLHYQNALDEAGYNRKLEYKEENEEERENRNKKGRSRRSPAFSSRRKSNKKQK